MFADLLLRLESTSLALRIGESWWFPLLESIHVVAMAFVLGSILMLDLRLLGWAAKRYGVSAISREVLPWTWIAFFAAVLTGIGLFITRATHYLDNPAFQFKLVMMLLAGVNMMLLHRGAMRTVATWDTSIPTPLGARVAAAFSLILWSGVVLAGRWVGHLN